MEQINRRTILKGILAAIGSNFIARKLLSSKDANIINNGKYKILVSGEECEVTDITDEKFVSSLGTGAIPRDNRLVTSKGDELYLLKAAEDIEINDSVSMGNSGIVKHTENLLKVGRAIESADVGEGCWVLVKRAGEWV